MRFASSNKPIPRWDMHMKRKYKRTKSVGSAALFAYIPGGNTNTIMHTEMTRTFGKLNLIPVRQKHCLVAWCHPRTSPTLGSITIFRPAPKINTRYVICKKNTYIYIRSLPIALYGPLLSALLKGRSFSDVQPANMHRKLRRSLG